MTFEAVKPVTIKHNGETRTFRQGETVDLDEVKAAPLVKAGVLREVGKQSPERMQQEYLALLARFWSLDDDPAATMDEARNIVVRLDALYQELHRLGRPVPVRLDMEGAA